MSESWEQLAESDKKQDTQPTTQPAPTFDVSAAVADIVNSMPQFSLDPSLPKLTPLSKTKVETKEAPKKQESKKPESKSKKESKKEPKKQESTKQEVKETKKEEVQKKTPVKVDNREHLNIVFIGHVGMLKKILKFGLTHL